MTQGSLAPAESPGLSAGPVSGPQPANLGDILERVLDKGIVIAGDIRVNLLDIELLTIKLRLVIASLDTASQVGINWWQTDPWLSADGTDRAKLAKENRQLRARLAELEQQGGAVPAVDAPEEREGRGQPRSRAWSKIYETESDDRDG